MAPCPALPVNVLFNINIKFQILLPFQLSFPFIYKYANVLFILIELLIHQLK